MAIGVGVPYTKMVLHGSLIAAYFNTPAALILFFFLVLFLNSGLGSPSASGSFTCSTSRSRASSIFSVSSR